MGCYINPRDMTKEQFLRQAGEPTDGPTEITESHLPVCLVDNGPFTAAAVGYSPSEVETFAREDGRRKQWFRVRIADLLAVSDIKHYI